LRKRGAGNTESKAKQTKTKYKFHRDISGEEWTTRSRTQDPALALTLFCRSFAKPCRCFRESQ